MNEKRKGIWIPVELMNDKRLDWMNKVLLSEIVSLHELPNGCFASNEQFAELLGIERSAVSKRITKLKKLGYIQTKDVYERNFCVGRIITPITEVPKYDLPEQKEKKQKKKKPIKQHDEKVNSDARLGSIESQNCQPDSPEDSSDKNHPPLTEEQGGSSPTTIGVVPERLGGSSHGNTINTSINSDLKDHLLYQYTGETDSFNSFDDLFISKEEIPTNLITSDNSSNAGSNPALPKISMKEYREIMNIFFDGYPNWQTDLMRLGMEEFVRRTVHYHLNKEEYVGMIREFDEL